MKAAIRLDMFTFSFFAVKLPFYMADVVSAWQHFKLILPQLNLTACNFTLCGCKMVEIEPKHFALSVDKTIIL